MLLETNITNTVHQRLDKSTFLVINSSRNTVTFDKVYSSFETNCMIKVVDQHWYYPTRLCLSQPDFPQLGIC